MNELPAVGSVVELEVTDQPYGPDAFGRLDGLAVFVSGAAVGDTVRATVTEHRKSFVKAEAIEVLTPSPHRVAPLCPLAEKCGGCQWQHISYERQLVAKREAVQAALERIGGWTDIAVADVVPSPAGSARNKANHTVSTHGEAFRAGYHEHHSHRIVDVQTCPLNLPRMDRALAHTSRLLAEGRWRKVADSLSGISARESTRGEVVIRLIGFGGSATAAFATELAHSSPEPLTGVTVSHTRGPKATERTLQGTNRMTETVGGLAYSVSAESFFQTNPHVTPLLVAHVVARLALAGGECVVDAYGGAGLFSLAVAGKAARVDLIETAGSSTDDARRTFAMHGLENCTVHTMPVERTRSRVRAADAVICDPPREGTSLKAAEALISLGAARLVYVACDPASLARDSRKLRDAGYRLTSVQPFDMFPQTYHVETVAVFEK